MPTRRAFVAAMIPAFVVFGIFWRWLDFPAFLAVGLGLLFGLAGLLVTRSVYDDAAEELEAWRRVAPDLAELDRALPESYAGADTGVAKGGGPG